jgi:uncharacterized membrane protein YcjF (UPF0283 family)
MGPAYRRTFSAIFLVLALVLFILAALGATGTLTWSHWQALGWYGLAAMAAALLPL